MKNKKGKKEKSLKLKSSNHFVSIYSNSNIVFNRTVKSIEIVIEPMTNNDYEKLYESFNRIYLKRLKQNESDTPAKQLLTEV